MKNFSFRKLLTKVCVAIGVLFNSSSLLAQQVSSDKNITYSVFLIGDAGAPVLVGKDPVLTTLQAQLTKAGAKSAVIYLGDNIYPAGLPPVNHPKREGMEMRLKAQLDILKDFPGRAFIVPGNHDWDRGRQNGWRNILEEERFAKEYTGRTEIFFPGDGCPGPAEIPLNDRLTLVILDTQWWLHPWDKPEEESDCPIKDPVSVIAAMEDIIERNAGKQIIVAAHHPLVSRGMHGGYFPFKLHVFPFTDQHNFLYIPLPVLGSLYPFYRKFIGDIQDLAHPKYKLLRKSLMNVFRNHPGLIYAAGHDHSLQYTAIDSVNYVVSGSGAKISHVKAADDKFFTALQKGFGKIDFFDDGTSKIEFIIPSAQSEEGEIIFSQYLIDDHSSLNPSNTTVSELPDSVIVPASTRYSAGFLKKAFLGENYRSEWKTPLKVKVLKLREEKGGLKILQRGGGMQTKSLRLEDSEGTEYVLRSVEKYPENAIPEILRGSFAQDLVQDQISASHPYGALVVGQLADAAGIPHTNPQLVFLPDDPALGSYRKVFANTLAIFEERNPASKKGEVEKAQSTSKVLEKLQEDNDNQVDQKAVLKARLFDLLIGDWDRHDDQWRWESEKKGKGKLYKPLPRDRDQAFFVNQGLLPKLASRRWALPKIQGFGYKIRYVEGFMFNGRFFDRTFLTQPSEKDWVEAAESLQVDVTDSIIYAALDGWPDEVKNYSAKEIASKLIVRRKDLKHYARRYYKFLAKKVDVAGSDKKEYFKVSRKADGSIDVSVFKISKKGEQEDKLYERSFLFGETKEIRLYGQGGEDIFIIEGEGNKGIKVRIIGGEDKDSIVDASHLAGLNKKNYIYDNKKGNVLKLSSESKNLTSDDPDINTYDRRSFKYDVLTPLVSVEYNIDDGVFLGGGFMFTKHGFRKEPFAAKHKLTANYAINTASYNFNYTGYFTDAIKKWDAVLDIDLKVPNYVNNFFGLGNESVYNKEDHTIKYYRVRFRQANAGFYLTNNIGAKQSFTFGPIFSRVDVEENPGRYINNFGENSLTEDIFNARSFGGITLNYKADTRDNFIIPTQGTKFVLEFNYLKKLEDKSFNFTQLKWEWALYYSFRIPATVTFATRFGGGMNFGDFEFYQANYLGGAQNLRGFRKTRFGGTSSFFNNTEVRIKLFTFRSYLFPAVVGIMAFNDVGRVWYKGEDSDKWHDGYGGGIWIAPFRRAVLSLMYGHSDEQGLPLVKLGFMF